jgi:hypothetical protein
MFLMKTSGDDEQWLVIQASSGLGYRKDDMKSPLRKYQMWNTMDRVDTKHCVISIKTPGL